MTRATAASLAVFVLLAGPLALAGGDRASSSEPASPAPRGDTTRAKPQAKPQPPRSPEEREAAALAFVRENHKELATLLEELKPMKPAEYERAIRDLYQVSRNLAALKGSDPDRYEAALAVWKARSRVELLTARLVNAQSPDLESELRGALETQLDAEVRQQKLELARAEARVDQLRRTIARSESRRGEVIANRYQKLLKKGQSMRRQEAGKAAAPRPSSAPAKGERKA